ncbi:cysteine desulfurase, SufS subfamily [Planctopirus limnophila DSM 3776]|uniref:Cysteine desulfurase n=1 Tax=Planctopirus limnophila (strain ATCC 43296 / DSM 3776 / IFAM 1008 / Mu 290) TaxID=521674 RepID=D5SV86_PLAL2|nr:SufS family cysteine desulfurase [Planctopirus limnophila]ADG67156.1 cysteine desulfurase, SufS subfamily [Planctopirus limnophila DSM 3776]
MSASPTFNEFPLDVQTTNDLSMERIRQIRQDFPILSELVHDNLPLVYLDSAATSQKPKVVVDKLVEAYEKYNSNVHRGIHALGDRMTTEMESAREKIARFIGASTAEQVIFTSGTTMSVNLVAHGWAAKHLRPGDEILLNEMEHHANFVPWQMAAQASGATLRFLPLTADWQLDLSRLDEYINSRTRLVAVAGMSNVTGTIHPVTQLADAAHAVGARIFVDAAQSAAHGLTNVQAGNIDFLAFSGHKLLGPTGLGILYGKSEALEEIQPVFGGGHMIREVTKWGSTWADLPARLEAGTAAFVECAGMGAAIDYLESIGMESIARYEHSLLELAHARISNIKGITIFGPQLSSKGAIISMSHDYIHAHDLADRLDKQGVAIRANHHCTMPLHELFGVAATARASFAFYNTPDEVEKLASAIEKAIEFFQRRPHRRANRSL